MLQMELFGFGRFSNTYYDYQNKCLDSGVTVPEDAEGLCPECEAAEKDERRRARIAELEEEVREMQGEW